MRFDGQTVIVTGAASGIGRAACHAFAREGATLICADINDEGVGKTVAQCGAKASPLTLDVRSEMAWEAGLTDVVRQHGAIDVLINCAGVGRNGDFEEFSLEDWRFMMDVNLTGVFLGCREAMRKMRPNKRGVIVNISSIGAALGGADIAGYCATKAGVTGLTKAVAMHGAPHGVRVCAIAPTYVDSEMLDDAVPHFASREAMLSSMAESVPAGRVARPDDIAKAILFMASDDAPLVTGSTLYVDGGQVSGMVSRHT